MNSTASLHTASPQGLALTYHFRIATSFNSQRNNAQYRNIILENRKEVVQIVSLVVSLMESLSCILVPIGDEFRDQQQGQGLCRGASQQRQ